MFQSIPINQYVDLVLCQGYPLPEDSNSSENASAALSTSKEASPSPSSSTIQDPHFTVPDGGNLSRQTGTLPPMSNGGRHHHHPNPQQNQHLPLAQGQEGPDPTLLQPELVSVPLVKGPGGFGFAIADCPLGQKVKMILDAQWCRGLLKGDVIKEINRQNVQTLSHTQVVDILKDLPVGSEVNVLVLRGAYMPHSASQQAPHPVSQQLPHPASQPSVQLQQRQEMVNSTETLSQPEAPSNANTLRSSSPKPDPSELYLKSKAILDSKRKLMTQLSQLFWPQSPRCLLTPNTKDLDVFIKRNQESGFGFRVLGGEGPDQPVYIGAIVPLGAAEKDGRLRAGDELLCIDGVAVKESGEEEESGQPPHQAPSALVNSSPKMPRVELPNAVQPAQLSRPESFDVTLQRKDNEGFGFVILTSKNKPPPGDRIGRMNVGDRISAVNGQSIMELSHNDIVQLIKDAGNTVTLTVVPEDALEGFCLEVPQLTKLPFSVLEQQGCLVELERSQRGFGFSLRGGKEYNMGLYILRLAEDGPALKDGRIHVGDQIVEINGEATQGITHTRAIELIQAGGNKVHLLLRPGQGLVPDHSESLQ
ncbi:hypothetical protein XENOCAPTIV_008838 [Xenoophorus captivus]|uniref:PDZ domain-containing protein n=1 Tax=Xenoophorus captivus TaxID=1517983 RepID=A0ABV0QHA4_9TELE